MHSLCVNLILVIISSISSENYGFPHDTLTPSTVADVIEVSVNRDISEGLGSTSATPSSTSTSNLVDEDDVTSGAGFLDTDVINRASTNDVDDASDVGRAVADLSQAAVFRDDTPSNSNDSPSQDGFPWWSLMLILLATVVIIIAIALPFVLYNRRLNRRRAVIRNSKRASELIVDSWMAASQSSIPGGSPSTSSDSGNEFDVQVTRNQDTTELQSNRGMMVMDDGTNQENFLGAEGGC
nr:uncharacterized protein LOC129280674 [Lytechinus pictus]